MNRPTRLLLWLRRSWLRCDIDIDRLVFAKELDREQLAFTLNYWLFDSVPLKLSYEFNDGAVSNDRFVAQFAYGF